ncbi:hypothetical protein HPP92_018902 [Vanilla planifolia]|uniref:Uncharacterized protein n=1 Tax=Vanilla planifolia TaxID=51239 RepID=A0A835UKG4_VANPL|nr:hypothetical protein HPP92_018902 [Vanilla planifolia]
MDGPDLDNAILGAEAPLLLLRRRSPNPSSEKPGNPQDNTPTIGLLPPFAQVNSNTCELDCLQLVYHGIYLSDRRWIYSVEACSSVGRRFFAYSDFSFLTDLIWSVDWEFLCASRNPFVCVAGARVEGEKGGDCSRPYALIPVLADHGKGGTNPSKIFFLCCKEATGSTQNFFEERMVGIAIDLNWQIHTLYFQTTIHYEGLDRFAP